MVPPEALREYRSFLEFRLLRALERRGIAYWSDVTGILTRALVDLGLHRGFEVSVEKRYEGAGNLRSDVHWQGETGTHAWEIDRTVKNASAAKLAEAPGERYWVLWARDNDLLSLRLLELGGINLIVLGHDVRKLAWDRLVWERQQRLGLHSVLSREGRFARARSLEAELEARAGRMSGAEPAPGGHPDPDPAAETAGDGSRPREGIPGTLPETSKEPQDRRPGGDIPGGK